MVTQPNEPTTATPSEATTTPADPSTPPNSTHLDLVYALIGALDKFAAGVPGLQAGDHDGVAKFIRGHLNIPDGFLDKAAATLEQTPALQGTQLIDAGANRDFLEQYQAYKLLFDKLDAMRNIMAYTVWSKKSALATDALRIYGISKQIALKPGNIGTAQHVGVMKQELGRKGSRKKKQPSSDPTTPAPQAPAVGQPT